MSDGAAPVDLQREIARAAAEAGEEVRRQAAYASNYSTLNRANLAELRERLQEPIGAVPCFLPSWSKVCRSFGGGVGLAFGWYVVLGGRTGLGKSLMGANAAAASVQAGFSAAIHSAEMEWDDNAVRALAMLTKTPVWKLEPGKFFNVHAFDTAVGQLEGIYDRTGARLVTNKRRRRKLSDVADGIREAWECDGVKLHIVDYLQLLGVTGNGYYTEDINARTAEISDSVLKVTEECRVCTIGLSQLNREGIKGGGRPEPYMLMGGSALDNDSRQVLMLDHTRYNDLGQDGWSGWMIIPKNRHGPAGPNCDIPIHVSRSTLLVRERMDDEVLETERYNAALSQATTKRRK